MADKKAELEQLVDEELRDIQSRPYSIFLRRSIQSIRKATSIFPFDPRFNSVHWAFDVNSLCREIAYSYAEMSGHARSYKKYNKRGTNPSDSNIFVSFYADNCITRIDSCRDKIALMVWAYYCAFNPEKGEDVLDYHKVMKRLKYPLKHGLNIKNYEPFLSALSILQGPDFDRITTYRNNKIHRREPHIEIYEPAEHHGWPYMIPLYEEKEIEAWRKHLRKTYPDDMARQLTEKRCHKHGVYFDQRKLRDQIWSYDHVKNNISSCFDKLTQAGTLCMKSLRRRAPLMKSK